MPTVATRVSSPAFIGRVEALGRIDAALTRASSATARTMVVGGEAGVGKTRLVREVRPRDGFSLTSGCIDLGERRRSARGEILHTLVRRARRRDSFIAGLPPQARPPRFGLVPPLEEGGIESPDGAARLFEVVLRLFDQLASERRSC
jgi:hypothetical protein